MELTGKKSGPPPWDQQLVRVARADNNWGPLIRWANICTKYINRAA